MKRQISALLTVVLVLAAVGFAQQTPVNDPPSRPSFQNGEYFAPNFGKYSVPIAPGSSFT